MWRIPRRAGELAADVGHRALHRGTVGLEIGALHRAKSARGLNFRQV
jgi:hypothetical protein